jgi:hypothetical protein
LAPFDLGVYGFIAYRDEGSRFGTFGVWRYCVCQTGPRYRSVPDFSARMAVYM